MLEQIQVSNFAALGQDIDQCKVDALKEQAVNAVEKLEKAQVRATISSVGSTFQAVLPKLNSPTSKPQPNRFANLANLWWLSASAAAILVLRL